eukprot:GHVQ01032821.1.p1 GENE.GHVQ01032821.1~~GHVQ01032821.1.p1  ORF type:complete len:960 (+),score=144.97 GHVQ01032821.1:913-3792(+)
MASYAFKSIMFPALLDVPSSPQPLAPCGNLSRRDSLKSSMLQFIIHSSRAMSDSSHELETRSEHTKMYCIPPEETKPSPCPQKYPSSPLRHPSGLSRLSVVPSSVTSWPSPSLTSSPNSNIDSAPPPDPFCSSSVSPAQSGASVSLDPTSKPIFQSDRSSSTPEAAALDTQHHRKPGLEHQRHLQQQEEHHGDKEQRPKQPYISRFLRLVATSNRPALLISSVAIIFIASYLESLVPMYNAKILTALVSYCPTSTHQQPDSQLVMSRSQNSDQNLSPASTLLRSCKSCLTRIFTKFSQRLSHSTIHPLIPPRTETSFSQQPPLPTRPFFPLLLRRLSIRLLACVSGGLRGYLFVLSGAHSLASLRSRLLRAIITKPLSFFDPLPAPSPPLHSVQAPTSSCTQTQTSLSHTSASTTRAAGMSSGTASAAADGSSRLTQSDIKQQERGRAQPLASAGSSDCNQSSVRAVVCPAAHLRPSVPFAGLHLPHLLAHDTKHLADLVPYHFNPLCRDILTVILGFSRLFSLHKGLSCLTFAMFLANGFVTGTYARGTRELGKKIQRQDMKNRKISFNGLSMIRQIRAHNTEDEEWRKYRRGLHRSVDLQKRDSLYYGMTVGLTKLISSFTPTVTLLAGWKLLNEDRISSETLTTFYFYAKSILDAADVWEYCLDIEEALSDEGVVLEILSGDDSAPHPSCISVSTNRTQSTANTHKKFGLFPIRRQQETHRRRDTHGSSHPTSRGLHTSPIVPRGHESSAKTSYDACQSSDGALKIDAAGDSMNNITTTTGSPGAAIPTSCGANNNGTAVVTGSQEHGPISGKLEDDDYTAIESQKSYSHVVDKTWSGCFRAGEVRDVEAEQEECCVIGATADEREKTVGARNEVSDRRIDDRYCKHIDPRLLTAGDYTTSDVSDSSSSSLDGGVKTELVMDTELQKGTCCGHSNITSDLSSRRQCVDGIDSDGMS